MYAPTVSTTCSVSEHVANYLALDSSTGKPLYMAFVKSETTKDYEDAVASIRARGYTIKGLVIDGKKSLFMSFADYQIQMCQFHMKQIVRPRKIASARS